MVNVANGSVGLCHLLLGIVHSICEEPWEYSPLHPVAASEDDPVGICSNQIVVEQ